MKKLITFSFLLFQVIFQFAQTPCDSLDSPASYDEPPGCYTCGSSFKTHNIAATPDTFDFEFACGTIENSIWISVLANLDGKINLTIEGEVCTLQEKGFEVGLYDSNLNRKGGCFATAGISTELQVQYHSLVPYEYYWLMIDGEDGTECFFSIEGQNENYSDLEIQSSNRRTSSCIGTEICYNSKTRGLVEKYNWAINPTAEIISGGEETDSFVCYRFDYEADFSIELEVEGFCFQNGTNSYKQRIYEDFRIINSTSLLICPGELPYLSEHGMIDSFGITEFLLIASSGCDSVINYVVTEYPLPIRQFDTVFICTNDFLVVDSQLINENGNYSFFYENGSIDQCDSSYQLTLTVIDTIAPEISCFYDSFIQKLGIAWTDNPDVLGYDLKINGDSIRLGNQFNYLFTPTEPNQVLDISVKAFSDICTHSVGVGQCIGPSEIVSAKDISDAENINLYPNPTSGLIKIDSRVPIEGIEVFDFSGRKVSFNDFHQINLSNQPDGVYIFKIKTSGEVVFKRMIKA